MPVDDFEGDTFVAFVDISGFKTFMQRNTKDALIVLDKFYSTGYRLLNFEDYKNLAGFFISDCAILFIHDDLHDKTQSLFSLLCFIRDLNKDLLRSDILLTTSIAFGNFKYKNKIEFSGIEKNPVYGEAYVKAFKDSEVGRPKLLPGKCRIMSENLPEGVKVAIQNDKSFVMRTSKPSGKYYYYYWMLSSTKAIKSIEEAYKQVREYQPVTSILKGLCNETI